jgi:hypothetical protein
MIGEDVSGGARLLPSVCGKAGMQRIHVSLAS